MSTVNSRDVLVTEPSVPMSYLHSLPVRPYIGETFPIRLGRTCDETPEREIMVIYEGEKKRSSITYRKIKEDSLSLAAALLDIAVIRGDHVGILAPNSLEYALVLCALLRLGSNAILLKYGSGSNDIIEQIEKYKISSIFLMVEDEADQSILEMLQEREACRVIAIRTRTTHNNTSCDVLTLQSLLDKGKSFPKNRVIEAQSEIQLEDHALVLFTSGSTGQPKAVQFSHFHVLNQGQLFLAAVDSHDDDFICFSDRTLSWAAGLFTFISCVVKPGTLVSVRTSVSVKEQNTDLVMKIIQTEGCTVALMMMYMLYDLIHFDHMKEYNLRSLKRIIAAGQTFPPEVLAHVIEVVPTAVIIDVYGSSETQPIARSVTNSGNIGHEEFMSLLPSFEMKIVDDHGKILPRGEIGEICLRNASNFLEYLYNKEATRNAVSASGWFHTHDLAVMSKNGTFKICGRKTDIIKRAGIKIFPAEVENILVKNADVDEVVVVGVPDDRLFEEICACVIATSSHNEGQKVALKEWCNKQFLPGPDGLSLAPKYFLFWKEFPKTRTGKTDRKTIKQLAKDMVQTQTSVN